MEKKKDMAYECNDLRNANLNVSHSYDDGIDSSAWQRLCDIFINSYVFVYALT